MVAQVWLLWSQVGVGRGGELWESKVTTAKATINGKGNINGKGKGNRTKRQEKQRQGNNQRQGQY